MKVTSSAGNMFGYILNKNFKPIKEQVTLQRTIQFHCKNTKTLEVIELSLCVTIYSN